MIFQISILLILIIIAFVFIYRKHSRVNLIDIFILCHVLFFGVYPILDILYGNYNETNSIFLLSYLYIIFSILLLTMFVRMLLPKKMLGKLYLKELVARIDLLTQKQILFFFLLAIGIILYFFYNYGLIFRVSNEELQVVNIYYQIVLSVVFPILTLVSTSSLIKLMRSKKDKWNSFLSISLLFIITLYWLFYSRRQLVFHLLIMGLIWFVHSKGRIDFKMMFYGFLMLVFLVIGSNVYQNLRWQIMFYSKNNELNISKSFLEMAFDFDSSDKNLQQRTSLLPILSESIRVISNKETSKGEILISSFRNVIPGIFLEDKRFVDDDRIVSRYLQKSYTDLASSVYLSFYVDFGISSIILVPVFLFFYFAILTFALFILKRSIIYFVLVFLVSLADLMQIESLVSSYMASIRQMVILVLIFFLFRIFFRKR